MARFRKNLIEPKYLKLAKYVGPTMANLRARKRMTQEDVVELMTSKFNLEITQSNLSRLETGGLNFTVEKFLAYCDILRTSPEEVVKQTQLMQKLAGLEHGGVQLTT